MNCQQTHELLDAYIDKELDVVNALEFERHLSECTGCRALCDQYQQLHASVKAQIPHFEAPSHLESKIRSELRPTTRATWLRYGRTLAVAAALLIVLLSAILLVQMKRRAATNLIAEQVVASHIRSLMANHLMDVPSSDQHTVKPWFNGKLDFAPVVRDLSVQGFPLVGGRLDYVDNHVVAALVYKRRQHTINLFLWPSSDSDSAARSITIRGYNLIRSTRSHMAYWAVSDLNAAELSDFMRDLQQ
jgi:anti-sigma factor RsiW